MEIPGASWKSLCLYHRANRVSQEPLLPCREHAWYTSGFTEKTYNMRLTIAVPVRHRLRQEWWTHVPGERLYSGLALCWGWMSLVHSGRRVTREAHGRRCCAPGAPWLNLPSERLRWRLGTRAKLGISTCAKPNKWKSNVRQKNYRECLRVACTCSFGSCTQSRPDAAALAVKDVQNRTRLTTSDYFRFEEHVSLDDTAPENTTENSGP